MEQGPPWSWPCGSWIYNCLCIQSLSPLLLWVRITLMTRCIRYNIMWERSSVTRGRSVVFSGFSGFQHQYSWPIRYSWNILESGIKRHNPNPLCSKYGTLICVEHMKKQVNIDQSLNLKKKTTGSVLVTN